MIFNLKRDGKNCIKEKDAISSRAKGVSLAIAAISAVLLLMGIGAKAVLADDWYSPYESGKEWGPGGSEFSWNTMPHEHHDYGNGDGRGVVNLQAGDSFQYKGDSRFAPVIHCHHGWGFPGYIEENGHC